MNDLVMCPHSVGSDELSFCITENKIKNIIEDWGKMIDHVYALEASFSTVLLEKENLIQKLVEKNEL